MKRLLLLIMIGIAMVGCNKEKNELYVYNWTEYMPDDVIRQFEEETGIKVIYTTYDTNEMMYSKLKLQDGEGYDIIVPSTYYVEKMAKEGLLMELDPNKVDFSAYRDELINQSYDPDNKYSVPYLWGTSLIMYNTKYIKDPVDSWADLWNPAYKGYVMLQNDVREVFQMALMTLGYSGNSVDENEIAKAYEYLKTLVPSVRVFNSDSPKQPFINEEVHIGLIWGGEAFMAMRENENLAFVYPKEGAIVWLDSIAIPSKAKNVDNAYKFIEFLARPEISAAISDEVGYASPSKEAVKILDEDYKNNRLMNPTKEDLSNSQFQEDIGDGILIYEKYWEKLKTGK